MEKIHVIPRSHKEMARTYPMVGLVEGWYFRQLEVSNGCFLVEGADIYGRIISKQTSNPDAALAECIEFAKAASVLPQQ